MSATTAAMLATAKEAGHQEAIKVLNQARTDFIASFKDLISAEDLRLLDELFVKAIYWKGVQYVAPTTLQANEAVEIYETCLEAMATIGDKYELVIKAKAGKLVRSLAHTIISGIFAVGGAVLQAGLSVALPGVGTLIGAGVNAGLQHVVSYFLERSEQPS